MSFAINNVPNGSYVFFAGTDMDGDRKLESDDLFGTDGGVSTPTVFTVRGSNITGTSLSVGGTSANPVDLHD